MSGARLDAWSDFRSLTAARIALGRAGGSVQTQELLNFGLAHARARDAVTMPFNAAGLVHDLQSAGLRAELLHSAATSREEYLRRPDLGRRLSDESRMKCRALSQPTSFDLSIIVSDGLSSRASVHAQPVVTALHARLASRGWTIAPIIVVPFARVAIQDEIGSGLNARISLILLGERPGLGSPDSLGAYFVWGPKVGRSDAERNCVSNIRPEGLPLATAVTTLEYLLTASRHLKLSGIALKDERQLLR